MADESKNAAPPPPPPPPPTIGILGGVIKADARGPRNDAVICNVSVSSDGNCIIAVDRAGTIYEGQRGIAGFYWHKIPVPTDCPEMGVE